MAGTVATDFAFFQGASGGGSQSDCDATTDWSGGTLDIDIYVQGTGSLSAKVSKATNTYTFTLASSVDLSSSILLVYMNCATPAQLDTQTNGGLRIRVEDASANWAEWYVGGGTTRTNGFFAVLTSDSTGRTESTTPPTYSAITAIGVACKTTASVAKTNFWWDAFRYGSYMQVYAGTSGAPATWDDFLTYEATNVIGAVEESDGIVFVQSQIKVGSTTAGQDTYFKDTSKAVVFRDNPFGTDFYFLTASGNATGDTQVYFGDKSGEAGIAGGTIRSAGTSKYNFDFSDDNIDSLGLYGVNFYDAGPSFLPTVSGTTREVLNCAFEACGEVDAGKAVIKNCNFVSADDGGGASGALEISDIDHNVSYCNFIACPDGVHISVSGTYAFDNMNFTGCTYDIGNDSGGDVVINAAESVVSTYENIGGGSTTDIVASVNVNITILDSAGDPVQNAQVGVFKVSDGTQLINEDSDVDGEVSDSVPYTTDFDVVIRVRKSSAGDTRYVNNSAPGTVRNTGLSATITLIEELVAT